MEVSSPWRRCQGTAQGRQEIKEEEEKMQMTGGKTLSVETPSRALFPWPEQTTCFVVRTVYFVSREMLALA